MSSLDQLNPMQQEAVSCTEGPLLVLAGAGSGKTRVLTHRIAYLIEEKKVNPWNILAITFTNKAAEEMRERVDSQVSFGASAVWVSTFHSACARILRRHIEFLGYTTHFTIYDSDDQKSLIKQVYKALNIDNRLYRERMVLSQISSAKNRLITPDEYIDQAGADYHMRVTGEIYAEYQKRLKQNDALDFDDLLMKTVELFRQQPMVLDYYQERFRYILVDEYQDTNFVQFELLRLLAAKYGNICVVGDDDQSIYRFRGADIGNILNFEDAFPGAVVVKLEQNYRSTQNILDAANAVISNNQGRKEKSLWTANGTGEKIVYRQFDQAYEEAEFIIRDILNNGYPYEDCAVLYRTNAQSRLLEEKCIACGVPYRLVGGVNFYQRKEIKDILAYLKTVSSGRDDVAVSRIINVPRRGIGAASLGKITVFAAANNCTLYEAMERAENIPGLGKAAGKIRSFTDQIGTFRSRMAEETDTYSIRQLIEDILDETGYRKELEEEGSEEADGRLENIEELVNKAVGYTEESEQPTLDGFLEEVALVADVDSLDQTERRVTLMTLHSAKGLEFENVYLSGLEDGVFPSYMTVTSDDPSEIEEERRLCYVGITRAKRRLTLTGARFRMVNGQTRYNGPSCFLEEIPESLITAGRLPQRLPAGSGRLAEMERAEKKEEPLRWMDDIPEEPVRWTDDMSNEPGSFRPRKGGGSGYEAVRESGGRSGFEDEERYGTDGRSEYERRSEYADGTGYGKRPGSSGLSPRTAKKERPAGTSRFAPNSQPDFGKPFTVQKSKASAYKVGDRVNHVKFGEGTVTGVEERARDYEVTVEFDRVGVRKIMASFLRGKETG